MKLSQFCVSHSNIHKKQTNQIDPKAYRLKKMHSVFDTILSKVHRAEKHIHDFDLALNHFTRTSALEVDCREDEESGKRIYTVAQIDPVPLELANIASDALHNLRSSLDHIAYQLVLKSRNGNLPDWNVHFPITSEPTQYAGLRKRMVRNVGQPAIDAIDSTEPYKGGAGHVLWQIKEANNSDKHNLLISINSTPSGVDIGSYLHSLIPERHRESIDPFSFLIRPANIGTPLQVGDILYSEPITTKKHDIKFSVDITLNVPGVIDPEPVLKTLVDMVRFVRNTVEGFRHLF